MDRENGDAAIHQGFDDRAVRRFKRNHDLAGPQAA
jgi:hypothetical protein